MAWESLLIIWTPILWNKEDKAVQCYPPSLGYELRMLSFNYKANTNTLPGLGK